MKERNYDETHSKIISAAAHLFVKQGWEKTSIQNIVDEVGDITRGAFYHHFKTKNDIIEAVSIELFEDKQEQGVNFLKETTNALERFREVLRYSLTTPSKYGVIASLDHLIKTPEFLFKLYEDGKNYTSLQIEQLIIEGNKDGSMAVEHPLASAEALALLFNLWLSIDIDELSRQEYQNKVFVLKQISDGLGVQVIDETLEKDLIEIYDLVKKNKTSI